MGHLALNHIYAQYYAESSRDTNHSIDITSAQMVLVMKLTAFAWSYYDGNYLTTEQFQTNLVKYQRDRAIKRHPSLLKFMSYVFFYPTLLTGPSFDYSDFELWLRGQLDHDKLTQHSYSKYNQINGKLAIWKLVQGLTWMVLFTLLTARFNIHKMLNAEWAANYSFWYKIHFMTLLGLIARFKYYAAWIIAEGSCILCGLSYNGKDPKTGQTKWNRLQNVNIWDVEFAQNTRQCLEGWNMNTNKWLKYYIYLRISPVGGKKKPGFRTTLFTFITSAFWHGVNAGYYMTFATGALYQTCGKIYRRNFRPIFLYNEETSTRGQRIGKVVYDVVGIYFTKVAFGYLVQPFLILNLYESIVVWRSVYFYGHLIILVTFVMFMGPCGKSVSKWFAQGHVVAKKEDEKKKKKEETSKVKEQSSIKNLKEQNLISTDTITDTGMNLGIPILDSEDIERAKSDWEMFQKEYIEWREHKGLEIEEENLKKAFQQFKNGMSDGTANLTRTTSFSEYL